MKSIENIECIKEKDKLHALVSRTCLQLHAKYALVIGRK